MFSNLPALMPVDAYLALCLYVMALTGTPGPANTAFLAVSSNFGIVRTLPFLLGTLMGFMMTYWLAVAGLLAVLTGLPLVWNALKIACLGYIIYLAWLIATAQPKAPDAPKQIPGLLRGFWVHPLNPKAYAMQVAAVSQFVEPDRYAVDAAVIALTFLVLGGTMNFAWVVGGRLLSTVLSAPPLFRTANVVLAVVMVASTAASLGLA